jgi:hypothetical protein
MKTPRPEKKEIKLVRNNKSQAIPPNESRSTIRDGVISYPTLSYPNLYML